MSHVIMLVGVNGVGKSTIADRLHEEIAGSVRISASEVLRNIFGGISRTMLESLSAEEKMAKMEPVLIAMFKEHAKRLIFFDTHLLVMIRRHGRLIIENIWSEQYVSFLKGLYFLTSKPEDILARRILDEKRTGRKRDLNLGNIKEDQDINLDYFRLNVLREAPFAKTILNRDGDINQTIEMIRNDLLL